MTRVSIDSNMCIGSGQCVEMAPAVFTHDEDGLGELLPGAEAGTLDEAVYEAARACPVQAILLDED